MFDKRGVSLSSRMAVSQRPAQYMLHARLNTGQILVFSQGIRPTFYPAGIVSIELYAHRPTLEGSWETRELTRRYLAFQRYCRAWLQWRATLRRRLLTPRALLRRETDPQAVREAHHLQSCRPQMGLPAR